MSMRRHRTTRRGWIRGTALCLLGAAAGAAGALGWGASPASAADGPAYVVIVNANNPASSIDRAFVAQAFLKKIRKWPHGETADPVDLGPTVPARHRFSVEVVGRSIEAVRAYWQQMIFSGRELPPTELASDAEVIGYVARKPGGIGYVSNRADLRGVKVLTVR